MSDRRTTPSLTDLDRGLPAAAAPAVSETVVAEPVR
jgi:hypothetical protein